MLYPIIVSCKSCGRRRDADDIAVIKVSFDFPAGGGMSRNFQYCADSAACKDKAQGYADDYSRSEDLRNPRVTVHT
jgi:hypothetical protein